jgi:hypothetical protein
VGARWLTPCSIAVVAGVEPAHAQSALSGDTFHDKINWQSVMFVGYGDERELADTRRLQPSERSA